jgi:multidrug transporter EmrE-like cation transporter
MLHTLETFGDYIQHKPNVSLILVFAVLIALFEAIAQSSLKFYSKNREKQFDMLLFLGIGGYIMVSLFLFTSYKYEDMGHMNLIWSCMSIIIAFTMGNILFAEHLNGYSVAAIGLALSSIYCGYLSDVYKKNIE